MPLHCGKDTRHPVSGKDKTSLWLWKSNDMMFKLFSIEKSKGFQKYTDFISFNWYRGNQMSPVWTYIATSKSSSSFQEYRKTRSPEIHKFDILNLIRGYQMSYGQWLLKCHITLFHPKQWKTAVKNLGCFGDKYAVHHNTVPHKLFWSAKERPRREREE